MTLKYPKQSVERASQLRSCSNLTNKKLPGCTTSGPMLFRRPVSSKQIRSDAGVLVQMWPRLEQKYAYKGLRFGVWIVSQGAL
jgi:hypothetical protein